MADIEELLTKSELWFLASQGLGPDDVLDVRHMPQWLWFERIEQEEKTVALGSPCRSAGHRLRSRRGHCVQCDTRKLAFQATFRAEQYVYIAGSASERLIKLGTCRDCPQRERQLRAERYGGADDWTILFSVRVQNAGLVEHKSRSRISHHSVARSYWKDGSLQAGIELLQCPYSVARSALTGVIASSALGSAWESAYVRRYEFDDRT